VHVYDVEQSLKARKESHGKTAEAFISEVRPVLW
jgi:hypothetical protein